MALMAAAAPATLPVPTRPQLQSVHQHFSDLRDQIRQVAHIIGLPDDWDSVQDADTRVKVLQRIVKARAEWVLRWILDKLKDETEIGKQARASPTAWKLMGWMVQILPVSRCASHLRAADFVSILEKGLFENFDNDGTIQPTTASDDQSRGLSESSETMQEDSKPSRKRKRGSSGTNTPSKRTAAEPAGFVQLFDNIRAVLRCLVEKATSHEKSEDIVHSEQMKIVLRTESAQAARILKFWFIAVQKLISVIPGPTIHQSGIFLDLSPVLEIWELRITSVDDDSGASAEEFSTECLIPTLILANKLMHAINLSYYPQSTKLRQSLDRLLARHVISPSRTAFLADMQPESGEDTTHTVTKANSFSSSLEPLRAKLIQAAQIQDAGQPIPAYFAPLFNAIPQLLDLVVRSSPCRAPRIRVTERPWVQAGFVSLAECAGCPMKVPEFAAPEFSITALKASLGVLRSHDIRIDIGILRDLFWFHSGVRYPINQERTVFWPFIAALIELDPDVFLPDLRPTSTPSDRPTDLAELLFHRISTTSFEEEITSNDDRMDVDELELSTHNGTQPDECFGRRMVLIRIIIPIMSAFARNRDLLGFIRRWDTQLCQSALVTRDSLKELKPSIWEDRALSGALAQFLEQSLTQSQISKLFKDYSEQLVVANVDGGSATTYSNEDYRQQAFSSTVIIPALLQSIESDEIIETLKIQLHSLFTSYSIRVLDDQHSAQSRIGYCWLTLCQLLTILWPMEFHQSADEQQKLLYPLLGQATKDVSATRKSQSERHVDSFSHAAATLFLLALCDRLRTVPNTDDLIQRSVRKAIKSMSSSRLENKEHREILEIFCAEYAQLLEYLNGETCQAAMLTLLDEISDFDDVGESKIGQALSQHIFGHGSLSLQDAFSGALLQAMGRDDNNRLAALSTALFFHSSPSSLSRERREAILDQITDILTSRPRNTGALLSIMVHLMEVPNATAEISSDGSALFNIAQRLHNDKLESPSTLQLLQGLVRLTLSHILPNKDQTQNKKYLEKLESKIASVLKKAKKCFPARLAILRAAFLAQKENEFLSPEQYVGVLGNCLDDIIQGPAADAEGLWHSCILDAFNEIALTSRDEHAIFNATQAKIKSWVDDIVVIQDWLSLSKGPPSLLPQVHAAIVSFRLYEDLEWLIDLTLRVLQEPIMAQEKIKALEFVRDAFLPLGIEEKYSLVLRLTKADSAVERAASYRLLNILVSTLDNKQASDMHLKQQQLALLPKICILVGECSDLAAFNALLDSVNTILDKKPSLTSQHSIECLLTVLDKLSSRRSSSLSSKYAPAIYARLCETSRLILLLHRGRLGGRFHLLLPLLQNLLLCLFVPNPGRGAALPPWLKSNTSTVPVRLTPANASQYARVLSTLCTPTESSVRKSHHYSKSVSKSSLNDPVKAARDYASSYLYPLLTSFCRFQLNGRLEAGVRSKLMPGIWEIVGLAAMDRESVDAMFAGLDRSTRDVWRETWSEWERLKKGRE